MATATRLVVAVWSAGTASYACPACLPARAVAWSRGVSCSRKFQLVGLDALPTCSTRPVASLDLIGPDKISRTRTMVCQTGDTGDEGILTVATGT